MSWFKRIKEGITTSTKEKLETPEGIWYKCPECKKAITTKTLGENLWVCPNCNYHSRIEAAEYFEILFDENKFTELFDNLTPIDFLEFTDLKPYGFKQVLFKKPCI